MEADETQTFKNWPRISDPTFRKSCKMVRQKIKLFFKRVKCQLFFLVSSMQRMIAQIGTPQDNQQLQTQLHQIQHYTGQLAKDTSTHLHDLSNGVSTLSQSEQRQWRLQKERLHNDFTKALNGFQAAQRTAAQKEKDVIKRARGAQAGGLAGPNQGRNLIDIEEGQGGQGQSQEEQQRRQQMLIQEEYDMEQLQERERSIRQLESDILDVNTIFKDLATLVHDQGEMIDSIEANVESTHVRVQEGTEHLRQAETYKVLISGIHVTFVFCFILFHFFTLEQSTQKETDPCSDWFDHPWHYHWHHCMAS